MTRRLQQSMLHVYIVEKIDLDRRAIINLNYDSHNIINQVCFKKITHSGIIVGQICDYRHLKIIIGQSHFAELLERCSSLGI